MFFTLPRSTYNHCGSTFHSDSHLVPSFPSVTFAALSFFSDDATTLQPFAIFSVASNILRSTSLPVIGSNSSGFTSASASTYSPATDV